MEVKLQLGPSPSFNGFLEKKNKQTQILPKPPHIPGKILTLQKLCHWL